MHDALVVAVVDSQHELLENMGSLGLGVELLLNDSVEHFASRAQLRDDVEVFFVFKVLVQLQNVRVVELLENADFGMELGHVLDLLLRNSFASSVLLGNPVSALGDDSEGSGPELFLAQLVNLLKFVSVLGNECLFFNDNV